MVYLVWCNLVAVFFHVLKFLFKGIGIFVFIDTGITSKVAVVPSKLKVTFGDTTRFFCSLKHSSPKAVFSWRKKGENDTIKSGDRFTLIPNGALQIRDIRFEEQGQYECIAENTFIARKHTSTVAGLFEVIPGMFYI